jgi:protein SCO1/2
VSESKRRPDVALWAILGGFAMATVGLLFGLPAYLKSLEPHRFHGSYYQDSKAASDFELIGQDGQPVRLSDFKNKIVLLDFGFTHCPNICPMALANIAAVYRKLTPEEQARVQVLFVTVDPRRDTPEVLRGYVRFFDRSFIGLTGSAEQIETTKKEYGVYSEEIARPGGDYTVDHSAYLYILDRQHRLRLTYGAK